MAREAGSTHSCASAPPASAGGRQARRAGHPGPPTRLQAAGRHEAQVPSAPAEAAGQREGAGPPEPSPRGSSSAATMGPASGGAQAEADRVCERGRARARHGMGHRTHGTGRGRAIVGEAGGARADAFEWRARARRWARRASAGGFARGDRGEGARPRRRSQRSEVCPPNNPSIPDSINPGVLGAGRGRAS